MQKLNLGPLQPLCRRSGAQGELSGMGYLSVWKVRALGRGLAFRQLIEAPGGLKDKYHVCGYPIEHLDGLGLGILWYFS